ncbi:MAG: 50S ribosomal protein L11 methyltransferase [Acidisphaera sp.]|nr:50S ribosomal protein L11 methyltransferase [Acidisphaera sp.]MBV9813990.1 50S ribosomal protein L11 methyltransferase [Acetobacteraceae bacterium]
MSARHATRLETVSVRVPAQASDAYEAAIGSVCGTVATFLDEGSGAWVVEGVKNGGEAEDALAAALALAASVSGCEAALMRAETPAEGWLARSYAGFPEQRVGRRFAIRGTHLPPAKTPGRITLTLDASVAFGSGEHGSTRGCLRALEAVAHRQPRPIMDLGTGSGILAMAAARLLPSVPIVATDIDAWAVRTAAANARRNRLAPRIRFAAASGWRNRKVRSHGPYNLVFANILARPLCRMATGLAAHLAPGGTAILSGLLASQAAGVLAAHRRLGLRLERRVCEGAWTTLVLRAAPRRPPRGDSRHGPT